MGDAQQMKSIKNTEKKPWWARLGSLTQRKTAPALPAHLRSGQAAEDAAVALLQAAGLRVLERNYKTPGRGGGEIDVIAQDGNTLVFVEVRARAATTHGGAAASVGGVKQRRIVLAARHYLMRHKSPPPCRFDVVAIDGDHIEWLKAAFDAA